MCELRGTILSDMRDPGADLNVLGVVVHFSIFDLGRLDAAHLNVSHL